MRAALERWLVARWYGGRPIALLLPLSALYEALARLAAWPWRAGWRRAWRAPCPVIVVGNLIAGGAGKTPSVISLVQALQAAGHRPGVISRGHGRRGGGVHVAGPASSSDELGDEPWLIVRRTQAPLAVAARRIDAAQALLAAHPEVDVLIADDGLQHHALARDLEIWVFDERGVGNGALLPAGPMRQRLPVRLPPHARVLYNAPEASTPLAGELARRALGPAIPLRDWHHGDAGAGRPLAHFQGRTVMAMAGIAAPDRFFQMLREAGLDIRTLPLPDHAPMDPPPWPVDTAELLCTEKDAAKIDPAGCGPTSIWVVRLDFQLPAGLTAAVISLLQRPPAPIRTSTRP